MVPLHSAVNKGNIAVIWPKELGESQRNDFPLRDLYLRLGNVP